MKSEKVELVYQYKEKLYIFQNVPAAVCQHGNVEKHEPSQQITIEEEVKIYIWKEQ